MGIRLDPEDRKTLEALAERWHLNAADIVRMAIKSLLEDAKQNGGKSSYRTTSNPAHAKLPPPFPPRETRRKKLPGSWILESASTLHSREN